MNTASEFFRTIKQSTQKFYGFTGLFISISLILLLTLCACNRKDLWENDSLDGGTLPEVTLTETIADTTYITVYWTDPPSSVVDHIEVEVESVAGSTPVAIGVQYATVSDVFTPSTPYTVTVRTADAAGNTSAGVTITVYPIAGGTTSLYIYTADDLNAVRGGQSGYSSNWHLGANYYLMADINLTASGYANWTPIGDSTNRFTGTFEGNNHIISNLTINTSLGEDYQGLFGYITGTVQYLTLTAVSLTFTGTSASVCTGSLAGTNAGTIRNITTSGTISNTT
ncbi:MAG: hypothetical protein JXN64_11910, partial [Spirochaetes bacterium]|nr:hypothetical protein [Spirochaetota bacterium]